MPNLGQAVEARLMGFKASLDRKSEESRFAGTARTRRERERRRIPARILVPVRGETAYEVKFAYRMSGIRPGTALR